MSTEIKARVLGRLASLGLLLLLFSFSRAPATPAQATKTYTNQEHGFSFQYPAAYELKGTGNYLDFNKAGKKLYSLQVDDRFIEMLYQMLRPGVVVYRAGEDPYRELARETRQNKELFRRYARNEAKNWCSADGPDGSVFCRDFKSETPFASRGGLNCMQFYLTMTREDFTKQTKQQRMVGPVFAACLPKKDLPVLLMISPLYGKLAVPELVQEMRDLIDSIRMIP